MKRMILLNVLFLMLFGTSFGQENIFGKWKTIDDQTGKPRSIVELYKKDGKAYGKVIKGFPNPGESEHPICIECEGKLKNQPIIGMIIITDMKFDEDDQEWEGGEILDPDTGQTYDCKLWLEDGQLKVRGYLSLFFRTQTWVRATVN